VVGARLATAADLADLARLWREALAEVTPIRGGAALAAAGHRPEPLEEGLAEDLGRPDRLLGCGHLDGVVLGMVAGRTRPSPVPGEDPVAVLELVYVEPAARAVGIGEAMLGLATGWARDRGCAAIEAPALPGARQAKAFFEGAGMVARLLIMHRHLDDPR
jgi:GNAT superfamily N-acetyltransferase